MLTDLLFNGIINGLEKACDVIESGLFPQYRSIFPTCRKLEDLSGEQPRL